MSVKKIPEVKPPYPFEAYSHVVSPLPPEVGGGFVFTMPDLPSLLADGETADEAVADGRAAFSAVISALMDMGRDVPAPTLSARDFTPISASGKFVAHVPRSIHSQLVARARTEGVSLNTLVLAYIAEGLGRRERQRT